MPLRSAFRKVRSAASSLLGSGGDPANTPTAATNTPMEGVSPTLAAQIESARIIEKLVELFGTPQQNNRLEISEDRSPSSKFDNVLNTSNLLGVQSEFIDSILTPTGGYYGIILRASPSPAEAAARQAGSSAARGAAALAGARSLPNSAWGLLIKQAYGTKDSLSTDVSESEELEQLLATETLKLPQYYVFIFSDLSPQRPIPLMTQSDTQLEFENISAYPKATVTNVNLRIDDLQPGTMIRVQYDGVDNKTKPVISEIVEDDPAFLRIVINSMKNRSSLLSSVQCATDSALEGVAHPTGDPVAGSDSAVNLHNAYMQLESQAGVNKIDVLTLYTLLKTAFEQLGVDDTNLVIGILANAKQESAFDTNIVSRVATESSIGLWQFNVQNPGYYEVPNSQIRQRAETLPRSIRIPTDQKVVPYFAGGLLLASKGVTAITPAAYDGTQDLKPLYDIVSNSTNQIVFVATVTKRMLDTINYTPGEVSAASWATWFQIYFEQPGAIHDRGSVASVVSSDLQDRGITV